MKKIFTLVCGVSCLTFAVQASATDLVKVYQRALKSDPTFQEAISTHMAAQDQIGIARGAILPSLDLGGTGTLANSHGSGGGSVPGDTKTRSYNLSLTAQQDLINFADFDTYSQAKIQAAAADATYRAAAQSLMIRVSTDYFNILKAKEELRYSQAKMDVLKRQLEQTQQQYRVGLKTLTDVDLAQSSYDNSVAQYIEDKNELEDAREDLRAVTGIAYKDIDELKDKFPLIKPSPENPDQWVKVATKQNWSLISDRLTAKAAKENIDIKEAAGYPTLNIQAVYANQNAHEWGAPASNTNHTRGPSLVLNLDYPILQGGAINSGTDQAVNQYEASSQQAELTYRTTVNNTRQDYLKIIATISQIKADRQAIKHGESALEGVFAGFRVGTKTMVDILTAQEQLFDAQNQYAKDRFTYIISSLQLKADTGTLSIQDLKAVNNWLISPSEADAQYNANFQKELRAPTSVSVPKKTKPGKSPKQKATKPKKAATTEKDSKKAS